MLKDLEIGVTYTYIKKRRGLGKVEKISSDNYFINGQYKTIKDFKKEVVLFEPMECVSDVPLEVMSCEGSQVTLPKGWSLLLTANQKGDIRVGSSGVWYTLINNKDMRHLHFNHTPLASFNYMEIVHALFITQNKKKVTLATRSTPERGLMISVSKKERRGTAEVVALEEMGLNVPEELYDLAKTIWVSLNHHAFRNPYHFDLFNCNWSDNNKIYFALVSPSPPTYNTQGYIINGIYEEEANPGKKLINSNACEAQVGDLGIIHSTGGVNFKEVDVAIVRWFRILKYSLGYKNLTATRVGKSITIYTSNYPIIEYKVGASKVYAVNSRGDLVEHTLTTEIRKKYPVLLAAPFNKKMINDTTWSY